MDSLEDDLIHHRRRGRLFGSRSCVLCNLCDTVAQRVDFTSALGGLLEIEVSFILSIVSVLNHSQGCTLRS